LIFLFPGSHGNSRSTPGNQSAARDLLLCPQSSFRQIMSSKTHAERQRGFYSFCEKLERRGGAASAEVPTFWFGQSDAETPCCVLTREQARLMKAAQLGKFENHGRTFRLVAATPTAESGSRFTISQSVESSESISLSEMLANVGITARTSDDLDQPAPRHIVQRAQEKVRAIRDGEGFDESAPLAFGSRAAYPQEEVVS
jgi:hypothetical protein